jgi:N-acetylneuraminate lyase
MKQFNGIFSALLTPFDSNDRINENALEKLIKFNVAKGVTGFYVGGTTGEAFLLSTEERKQIMEIVKAVAPEKTLIAHVGSINEREAIELGKCANRLGYDAVSSVAPFYYKFSFEEIKNYYFRVAEESALPMFVYHFPAFSGVNMGMKEIGEFLADDKFIGIKYTANDFFTMERCKTQFPNKLVYNGYDEMFLAGLAMGADGAIGSTFNFMAEKFVLMQELFRKNCLSEAQALQTQINEIITVLCQVGVMAGEKEILNQLGFGFGNCRAPFKKLAEREKLLITEKIMPFVEG